VRRGTAGDRAGTQDEEQSSGGHAAESLVPRTARSADSGCAFGPHYSLLRCCFIHDQIAARIRREGPSYALFRDKLLLLG